MKHHLFGLFALLFVAVAHATPLPGNDTRLIINGYPVRLGELPYQVSLRDRSRPDISAAAYQHICGGSIIDKEWIVTAAHCVSGRIAKNLYIVAGTVRLNAKQENEGSAAIIDADLVITHKGYSPLNVINDIALIKLKKPLTYNENTDQVSLIEGITLSKGAECIVSGWGTTVSGQGNYPDNLMAVKVPYIPTQDCKKYYQIGSDVQVTDDQICAGYEEGDKDSCQGDSGGPLVCNLPNGSRFLAGVVSWGKGCAAPKYPGVYSSVAYFSKWISSAKSDNSGSATGSPSPKPPTPGPSSTEKPNGSSALQVTSISFLLLSFIASVFLH